MIYARKSNISILALVLSFCLAGAAQPATLAADPATIAAVLKAAGSGDVVTLAPGLYPPQVVARRTFAPPIRITGPRTAELVGWRFLSGGGLNLDGVTVSAICPGPDNAPKCGAALSLEGWKDGRVSKVAAVGSERLLAGQPYRIPDGYGIRSVQSSGIIVEDSILTGFNRGIVFDRTDEFAAIGNQLSAMRVDGIDVALSHRGLIARNSCEGFRRLTAEHPDCIQVWSRPEAAPTSDLKIVQNRIVGPMQGIGLFDHVRNGIPDGGFDRILVEDNEVAVSFPQAIALTNARGSVVRNNRVSTLPVSTSRASINVVGGSVELCGNTVAPGAGKPGATDGPCAVPGL